MLIEKQINEIAAEMSIPLSSIQLIDGRRLGYKSSFLLKMTKNDSVASTILHQENLLDAPAGPASERCGHEIRKALCRLQSLLKSS